MNSKNSAIMKQHIGEILEYQSVLSIILKRKVTIDQAMADWLENVYHKKEKRSSHYYL